MTARYDIACNCGEVRFTLTGEPRVRGFCHCSDCRDLLDVPYHSVTAWNKEQVDVVAGADRITVFQHPGKQMKRFFCSSCGETLFNSNAKDWRVVSQMIIAKAYGGQLPDALSAKSHFFYAGRVVDVDDDLPKHD